MTIGRSGSIRSSGATILGTLVAALCISFVAPVARASQAIDCHVGTYRLSDGEMLDIAPSDNNALRWRRFDGTTG